ncbi:type III secretion system translocator chaperone SicA (plasmid) [Burkholderia pyrrocinia]|uniref:type III secretion system translocator chaperone SicA n=1 Tax=Burkholderia pyrrocinia TaxID=60550 RepID=UPI0038B41ED5
MEQMASSMIEAIQSGATIKDIQGVSQDMMDGVYAYAYRFYQQGKLDEAEVFFRFLCIYDFYNVEYAMGLAAVFQLKGNYAKAIDLYALAFALAKDDYRPMLHVGQCHLMLGKAALARRSFSEVVAHTHDERLKVKAQAYLEGLDAVDGAVRQDKSIQQP